MCTVMNLLLIVFFVTFPSDLFGEGEDDTYETIYVQQQQNVDNMLLDSTAEEKIYTGIQDAFIDTLMYDGIIADAEEKHGFVEYLGALKSLPNAGNFTRNRDEFGKFMNSINLFMVLSAPAIYEAIQFKTIADLGPLENIFTMSVEFGFMGAWGLIVTETSPGRCLAYDHLLLAVNGTPAQEYIENVYDKALCTVSNDTMEKWHQVFDEIHPDYREYLLFEELDDYFPVFEFAKIAKAYRPAVYNQNFEKYANTYPIIIALYNAIKSTAFTKDEKDVLRQLARDMRDTFPDLGDLEDFEHFTVTRFAQIVSKNASFFKTFGKIQLMDNSGTFYDLIMWITRKQTLDNLFSTIPHYNFTEHAHLRFAFWDDLKKIRDMLKPCLMCTKIVANVVPLLANNKGKIEIILDAACDLLSIECGPGAPLCLAFCTVVGIPVIHEIISYLAENTSQGEICPYLHIC